MLYSRTLNVSKPRPQSWKPTCSNDLLIDVKKRAITTPASFGRSDADLVTTSLLDGVSVNEDGGKTQEHPWSNLV